MEEKKFVRLSQLVNATMRVEKVWGYKFKFWDNENRKMLMSDTWQKDYKKTWQVDTDKGSLDISVSQMRDMLEEVCDKGEANVVGKTYEIKSNGKEGMEIRYFFNAVRAGVPNNDPEPVTFNEPTHNSEDTIPNEPNLNDIPF